MNERIREFLYAENKSSAQLAEEIGVQPSGISHILSGRNNPSLDFVIKMLEKYKNLSTDWLLFGNGPMYKESATQSLFNEASPVKDKVNANIHVTADDDKIIDFQNFDTSKSLSDSEKLQGSLNKQVVRIVWFYNNNSFEEFYPGK